MKKNCISNPRAFPAIHLYQQVKELGPILKLTGHPMCFFLNHDANL